MRLDKYLSHTGFGSRKEVKQVLKRHVVEVNHVRITDGKFTVDETQDEVKVDGELIRYQALYYYLLNKPKEVISATEDRQHRTVLDLLSKEDYRRDIFPVGRLDKDTTGLLILTNDGPFSHSLLSPKKHVPKRYRATVNGLVTEADGQVFAEGVTISGGERCQPAALVILTVDEAAQRSVVTLTITEGKYHQVKRMFEAVGKQVIELHRETMGALHLDDQLASGDYRELTKGELDLLKGES